MTARSLAAALVCLVWSLPAAAASLRTEVSARQVAVGERVVVRVVAVQEDGDELPSQPALDVKGKADTQGPSIGTQRTMRMHNFSMTQESSVVATWYVTPTAEGRLVVGPARFHVGNQVLRGESIEITVGPASSNTNRRNRDPLDPFSFDPFGGRFPFPDPRMDPSFRSGPPEAPERLKVEHAPNSVAFLRVLPSQRKVVVGQPFTVEIWAYGSRGNFREVSPTEPTTADFLSYVVVEHSQEEPPYSTTIDGQSWYVTKLRELILVPLRTGKLSVGGMEVIIQGPSYPARGSRFGTQVKGPTTTIEVVEPPVDGRPDGYLLGDVGKFTLRADVNPKKVKQGDYSQLTVTISGSGNLPSRVLLPSLPGIEWQEPRVTGGPSVKDGKLRGSRTVQLAFSAKNPGRIELGEVTLPFYEAQSASYQVARAALGELEVEANPNAPVASQATADAADAGPKDSTAHTPTLRPTLSAFVAPSSGATRFPWMLLLAAPLLALLVRLGVGALRLVRRRGERSSGQPRAPRATLQSARDAARAGDLALTTRELERALYDALERATGLKGRGVLRAHLAAALREAGLAAELAEGAQSCALALEALRYEAATSGAAA
ncbi:MAG TPA: BatD family protein, partial [Polyangiaceae bacterium]|nr:BatD family protein [Polyangiaceae bacterium]